MDPRNTADRLNMLANEIEALSFDIEDADTRSRRLHLARRLGRLADELLTAALEVRELPATTNHEHTEGGENVR